MSQNECKLSGCKKSDICSKPNVKRELHAKPPFGTVFTDHMLKIEYDSDRGGWQEPQITQFENLSIHPAAKALHYGLQGFEGMKAYRGVDGTTRLFRPILNLSRLNVTAERCCMPQNDCDLLLKYLEKLVYSDRDSLPDDVDGGFYVRPCIISLDNVVKSSGCHMVLWLFGEEKYITEAGVMNVFVFYVNENGEKELLTPPLDGTILPGITRQSVIELSREWKEFKVVEKSMTIAEIIRLNDNQKLLEIFGVGTATIVCPFNEIMYEDQIIKLPTLKQKDPLFGRFLKTLSDIQYGRISHPWSHVIDPSTF